MKKIYLCALGLTLSAGVFAQNLVKKGLGPAPLQPGSRVIGDKSSLLAKTQGGVVKGQYSPIDNLLSANSNTANVSNFYSGLYMDSTGVLSTSSSNGIIFDNYVGNMLDVRSVIFDQVNFNPLFAPTDMFTIDSVFIQGIYKKVDATQDTLYIMMTWGDTTNTNLWRKTTSANWVAPINSFSGDRFTPRISTTSAQGNAIRTATSVPAANKQIIKYLLSNTDTVALTSAYSKFLSIKLPTPITIPASNIVSCAYTFVPGKTYPAGQIVFSQGGSAQQQNGFAYILKQQTTPPINTIADVKNYLADAYGKNGGISISKSYRYNQSPASWSTLIAPDFISGPVAYFNISGNSTVGVNELEKLGFELGQNMPNPYNGSSVVRYQLAKDVKSVKFTVTDMMGRVITQSTESTTAGVHAINLGSYSAGVYYYSLEVDGTAVSKKMIVQ